MNKKKEKKQRRVMRLLPLTVTMMALLFVIKMNELYIGSQQLRDMYSVRDAVAEEKAKEAEHGKEEAKKEDAKPAEAAHGEDKKEVSPADIAKPSEEAAAPATAVKEGEIKEGEPAKTEEAGHGEAKKEEGGHGGGDAKPPVEEKTFGTGKSTVKEIEAMKAREAVPAFTKTELDLLQNLSKRREELDSRENELDLKSKVLEATEKRINDKIVEVKTLQTELSKVLAQYNEKQDTQIKSLVKIYESMKPDEAAAIFNEMEMPILLEVIAKMSERKVALVLANMSPKKAKDVTQELADKRKKSPVNAAAAAVPAAR